VTVQKCSLLLSNRGHERPRRGSPEQTRERLITAAAIQFNRFAHHGADSNSIAKEAGYATGTFYKHFRDKREIFLAAYERWLMAEWTEIGNELARMQKVEETARRLVELSIRFHTKWRGLRASLILVFNTGLFGPCGPKVLPEATASPA
jgi:AcrR family transcriptional regulator